MHRPRRPIRGLVLMLIIPFTMAITISAQPASQSSTATPVNTLTYTPSPYTPTITPTPSHTPTPIPTLDAVLSNSAIITAANAERLSKLREWQAHFQIISGIAFIPGSTHLVTSGWERSDDDQPRPLRMWDVQNEQIVEIEDFFEGANRLGGGSGILSLNPEGTRVVLSSYAVQVWDTETGRLMGRVLQRGSGLSTLAGNGLLFVGGPLHEIIMWMIPEVIPVDSPEMGPLPTDYVFDPQGVLYRTYSISEDVDALAFSNDTHQVFALTRSGRLLIFKDIDEIHYDLRVVPQAPAQGDSSTWGMVGGHKMVMNEARHEITYTDKNRDVIVYDYVNNTVVDRYERVDPIACLNYSPDGRLLLLSDWGWNMSLQLFDTTTHEMVAQVITGQAINSCTMSWDGRLIATGDTLGKVVLWGVPAEA